RQGSSSSWEREAPIGIIGGAGALRRDHADADGGLRGACRPENLALPGFDHTFEDLAALARLRISHPNARNRKTPLSVPIGKFGAEPESAPCDKAHAAPFKERT